MSPRRTQKLRTVTNFPDLVDYLRDDLDWPIEVEDAEDIVFDYDPAELGIDDKHAAKINRIWQIRPLADGQPWGVFYIDFESKKLPVVVLRRILRAFVASSRSRQAEQPVWNLDDLLFISAFGEEAGAQREIAFAHFHQEAGDLPTLRVLGWDGSDTPLKLDFVDATLQRTIRWPDDPDDHEAWRETWAQAFKHRLGHVIRTADALAKALAKLARQIRAAALLLLEHETESGPLRSLHKAFQKTLIHDLTETDFADTYAQTITYGLLTAAISRTEMADGADGTALIADNVADIVPVTNPFLKEMLQTFLRAGGRKGGIDFDELGIQDVVELLRGDETDLPAILRDFGNKTKGEDPVIHFYEHFLAAYDKALKVQRGVFYTPKPVVSYIVRSVHELLQTEFGLEDGLADTTTWGEMVQRNPDLTIPDGTDPDSPFVVILDPATGTATFLVEVIEVIHQTMTAKWKRQRLSAAQRRDAWNAYVPQHLLPRLYGYELMMAPYAIAHMKVSLKLKETQFTAWNSLTPSDRLRIYLTNALESANDQIALAGIIPALAHEAQAVNSIKRTQKFTIVIGNPPYSHLSSNLSREAMDIVEPYKFINGKRIQERGALSLQKNLQDDYIKFIRIAERTIETVGIGIVGFITNNSYLDSRSFRGMRLHLGNTFDDCWVFDLHGSGKKQEKVSGGTTRDVNVFDIMQGVAITLFAKYPQSLPVIRMRRADILGSRKYKNEFLSSHTFKTNSWQIFQIAPPFFLFVHQDLQVLEEYQAFPSLKEIFPVYSSGVKTHRDNFAYSFAVNQAEEKLNAFCDQNKNDDEIRNLFKLKDTNVWSLHEQRKKVNLSELQQSIMPALYRPFDVRVTCFSDEIIELTRRAVMDQMLAEKNLSLLCSKQQAEEGFRHVFCTRLISDWGAVSNRTRESTSAFPLFLHRPVRKNLLQEGFNFTNESQPNVQLKQIKIEGVTPDSIFYYVYSILHAPAYRGRYATFLRADFPRIPFTNDAQLFRELAQLGADLVALHLHEDDYAAASWTVAKEESPLADSGVTFHEGADGRTVGKFGKRNYENGRVYLDSSKKVDISYFDGIEEDIWQFQIGGYQVLYKWLYDRRAKGKTPGRTLSDEDIRHYPRIVAALRETIRLMGEIDEVIEDHGGWPLQ